MTLAALTALVWYSTLAYCKAWTSSASTTAAKGRVMRESEWKLRPACGAGIHAGFSWKRHSPTSSLLALSGKSNPTHCAVLRHVARQISTVPSDVCQAEFRPPHVDALVTDHVASMRSFVYPHSTTYALGAWRGL